MNVTRAVVQDLLTLYVAQEASSDTRLLVEEWLRTDPALARQAELARSVRLPAPIALSPTVEKKALDITRRRLRRRQILLGSAVYVSTLPLSVTFNSTGFTGLLIDNWPERSIVIALAIVLWTIYWRLTRRMRVAGL